MAIIKRNIFIILIICMLLPTLLLGCDTELVVVSPTPAQEAVSYDMAGTIINGLNYRPQDGDIVTYTMSKEEFQDFLRGRSIDISQVAAFRKSSNREGFVECTTYSVNDYVKYEYESGTFRIGSWPVYTEFIDFMNAPENFRQILSEHGIDEELLSYDIIEHYYLVFEDDELPLPGSGSKMCIWLHTDAGDYFLEDNPDYDNPDPLSTTFTYKFYDLAEYAKKIR